MKKRLTPKPLGIIVISFGGIKTRKNKMKNMKLITLNAPGCDSIYVCGKCAAKMNTGKIVMRDHRGIQYCTTERGLTNVRHAVCDCCAALHDGSLTESE